MRTYMYVSTRSHHIIFQKPSQLAGKPESNVTPIMFSSISMLLDYKNVATLPIHCILSEQFSSFQVSAVSFFISFFFFSILKKPFFTKQPMSSTSHSTPRQDTTFQYSKTYESLVSLNISQTCSFTCCD